MRGILGVVVVTALPVLAVAFAGYSEFAASPDVQFLASDIHFTIGGQHVAIPAVAMRQPDQIFKLAPERSERMKDRSQIDASDADHPVRVEKIDLSIRQYQYAGEHVGSLGICPLLKRKWSEALCRGQHHGLLSRLPEKFDLLDRDRLDLLKSQFTVGGERAYDQMKDMILHPGVTEIGCDRRSQFCTATVEILPGLLAVWTVWSNEQTGSTARQMAEAQGPAIVQFVQRGTGPAEDPTLVDAD